MLAEPWHVRDALLMAAAPDLAALVADLWAELERRDDEIAHLRRVVDICTGTASMPPIALGDNDAKDQIVKLRSALVGMVVRELGRSCVQVGGENNLSVMFQPESGEHEWAGWRYEVHVTKPGGKSPTEQRDDARTALREALGWLTERGHPGKPCIRSGWIDAERVVELRRLVDETTPTPKATP